MNKNANLSPVRSLCLASATVLLVSLAGTAAHAQAVTPLTAPPTGPNAATTSPFPLNDSNGGYIYGPLTSALGSSNSATFTASNPGVASFETFDNSIANGTPLAYPVDTIVLDTFDGGDGHTDTVTGPLEISFSSPVSAFGLTVESARFDTATFSFTAYDGAIAPQNIVGTYSYAPVTQNASGPQSLFLGGQAVGVTQITNVVVSDVSDANGYFGGTNDFFFGPLTAVPAAVPEASTTVSFGMLLMLGLGGVLLRRKMTGPKAVSA